MTSEFHADPWDSRTKTNLSRNAVRFARKGRDEGLRKVYTEFAERRTCWLDSPEGAKSKGNNPLLALQAAPGGGKSFFLDALANITEEDLDRLCANVRMRGVMRGSVVLRVTFTTPSEFTSLLDECESEPRGHDRGLAVRMLWTYFGDVEWERFVTSVSSKLKRPPTVKEAFLCIHSHSTKPILLCVDELLRASYPINPRSNVVRGTISAIGKVLTSYPDFNAVVSTLDAEPVNQEAAFSGRPIRWVPLPPLGLSDAISLFKEGLLSEKPFLNLSPKARRCIKLCISDCNGHPRSLENLAIILNRHASLAQAGDYTTLMNLLASTYYRPPLAEHVRLALLGDTYPLEKEVVTASAIVTAGDNKPRYPTLASLISQGVFLNADTNDIPTCIPRLSPLLLRAYTTSQTDDRLVVHCLTNLLATESNFSGTTFELFHAWWEVLRRILVLPSSSDSSQPQPSHTSTLLEWYKLRAVRSVKNPEFIVEQKDGVLQLDDHFPPSSTTFTAEGVPITFLMLTNNVLMPKVNNPGFDMVLLEKKATGRGYIAIHVECKFSSPQSSTVLNRAEILNKYDLMKKQYQRRFGRTWMMRDSRGGEDQLPQKPDKLPQCIWDLQLEPSDLYLVVVSFRESSMGNSVRDNGNLIVVGRDTLVELYGPTLSTRPQFLASNQGDLDDLGPSPDPADIHKVKDESAKAKEKGKEKETKEDLDEAEIEEAIEEKEREEEKKHHQKKAKGKEKEGANLQEQEEIKDNVRVVRKGKRKSPMKSTNTRQLPSKS
jgi:hypothetical protein